MRKFTEYPKAMYKAVDDYAQAKDKDQEAELREDGYLAGAEFWKAYKEAQEKPKGKGLRK